MKLKTSEYKFLYLLSHFGEITQVMSTLLGDEIYLTEGHIRYLCVQNT